MPPASFLFFSPILRRYVRQLQLMPDLQQELAAHPKNAESLIAAQVRRIRVRLSYFYKVIDRLHVSNMSLEEHEAITWFLENRTLLGGSTSAILGDARRFHDRLDGENIVPLLQSLNEFLNTAGYQFTEEDIVGMVTRFTETRTLSTDEAQSLPFFTRLLVLSRILVLSETLLVTILAGDNVIPAFSLRSLLGKLPQRKKIKKQRKQRGVVLYRPLVGNVRSSSVTVSAEPLQERIRPDGAFGTLLLLIENVIETLRTFGDIDWETLVANASDADRLLTNDPAGMYTRMTLASRTAYKERLRVLSRMTGVSERQLAEQALVRAQAASIPYERHVGYWVMDAGNEALLAGFRSARYSFSYRLTKGLRSGYMPLLAIFSVLLAAFVALAFPTDYKPFIFLLALFPALRASKQFLNSIVRAVVPPVFLPALDFRKDLSAENATVFVIPAFLSSEVALQELLTKLEVAYLGNRGKNIHFCLLLDSPDSRSPQGERENQLKIVAKEAIRAMNERYGETEAFQIFLRESLYNESEGVFMAWERKRGKLLDFMRALREQKTSGSCELFPGLSKRIEFVLVVDEDAHVPRELITRLISLHAHPLRRPLLGAPGEPPIHGSTFVQPHVALWFNQRTQLFPRIFGQQPTPGSYSIQVAETYQDLFGRGSFIGKGSIHVDAFLSCFEGFFPENQVLSHDLLEGSVGGTTFANEVTLYDEFPLSIQSFITRMHRWIRGDWQTIPWLFSKIRRADGSFQRNPLNRLDRFKIFDNLVESLVPATTLAVVCIALGISTPSAVGMGVFLIAIDLLGLVDNAFQLAYLIRSFFTVNDTSVFARLGGYGKHLVLLLRRSLVELGMFPYVAGTALDAIVRSIYRQRVSHKQLLEWSTASAVERQGGWRKSVRALVPGFVLITIVSVGLLVVGIHWLPIVAAALAFIGMPFVMKWLCARRPTKATLSKEDEKLLATIATRSWNYFDDIVQKKTGYLPPDHIQESPHPKVASYTSVTNVGFYLISILCAQKLGLLPSKGAMERIEKTVTTLEQIPRAGSLFYNWYSVKTLEQDEGCFISSVDAGNLLACLVVVSSWLMNEMQAATGAARTKIQTLYTRVETLLHSMDFQGLVSRKKLLLAVGLDAKTHTLSPFYYQTLASESRLSVLLMLAKRDLPIRAWSSLSRIVKRQPVATPTAASWSGTLFEYLMPNLFLEEPQGSIMETSSKSAYANHRAYLEAHDLYGAISESGYAELNSTGDYGYKAFGVPNLSLSPRADGALVVAPYAVAMALSIDEGPALRDLHKLAKRAFGRYGFYEAIDYRTHKKGETVASYMSHHQGMVLVAVANFLHGDFIKKLFCEHPLVQTTLFLIDEVAGEPTKELFPEKVGE